MAGRAGDVPSLADFEFKTLAAQQRRADPARADRVEQHLPAAVEPSKHRIAVWQHLGHNAKVYIVARSIMTAPEEKTARPSTAGYPAGPPRAAPAGTTGCAPRSLGDYRRHECT
jgi:hypothetical protein